MHEVLGRLLFIFRQPLYTVSLPVNHQHYRTTTTTNHHRYWCLKSSQPDGFGPSIFAYELDSSEDITFTIQFTDEEASGPVLAP